MMSHSHAQPSQQCLRQLPNEHPESSLSTSQAILHKTASFSSYPLHFQTSTSATLSSTRSHSSFVHKIFSSSHQHSNERHSSPFSFCFNVSSKRWGTLKLSCSNASSMASQVEFSLRSPSEIRKKKIIGQKKREELEREVSLLQSLLYQEEKIHEILEMVHNRPAGSEISIPDCLPPKIKEILAELVMVESVIVRLECHICQLLDNLKHEQQGSKESKSKAWNQGNLSNSSNYLSTPTIPIPSPLDRTLHERMGFETKALHFISKAIKGVRFQDRLPGKSGMVKPAASPLGDRLHPSPKPRECNMEMYIDLPTKNLLDPLLSEESVLQWQPNKLSEERVKAARSINTEKSIPRDIGSYKNLVIFTSSSMDLKFISSPYSIPLLRKLRVLMSNLQNLQTVYLSSLTYQQKLAFWINMYNPCVMHGFVQYGVPSTPEKFQALMNKATLKVGGNTINAQAIEHFILKKRSASNMQEVHRKNDGWEEKESVVRELYGLESMDPNVTFALCCGTRSSPAVRIYTAEGVTAELEKSKLDYLHASIMVISMKKIAFPELLLRNMLDFAIDTDSLLEWVWNQLPTSGTLRKSMVDCFRSNNTTASNIVEKIPYDYEFQYLLRV